MRFKGVSRGTRTKRRRSLSVTSAARAIKVSPRPWAIAAKVCGAGGGGCIAFYCENGRRGDVEAALAAQDGAKVLDWAVQTDGLTVTVSDISTAAN